MARSRRSLPTLFHIRFLVIGVRVDAAISMRRWVVGKPAVLTPNLLKRQCAPTKRDTTWATDMTYIPTWQGWLWLAVVIDRFFRKVVGGAAGPTIHRELLLKVW